jgi:AAA15 family ATPase/GTPase
MQYLNFEITNFKGIGNVKLDLTNPEGRIFTLVGLNESGKTTILEAIASLWDIHRKPQELIPKNSESNFTDSVLFSQNDIDEISKYLKNECGIREIIHISQKITFTREYNFKASAFINTILRQDFSFTAKKKGASKVKIFDSNSEESRTCSKHVIEKFKPQIVYFENFLFDIPSNAMGEGDIETLIVNRMRNNTASDQQALRATIRKMGAKITELVLATWGEIMKYDYREACTSCLSGVS